MSASAQSAPFLRPASHLSKSVLVTVSAALLGATVTAAPGEWANLKGSSSADVHGVYGSPDTFAPGNTPGSRHDSTEWRDVEGNLWIFGGNGYAESGPKGLLNDLWKYDVSDNQWAHMSGSKLIDQNGDYGLLGTPSAANIPGGRTGAASWIDSAGDLWLFGGSGRGDTGIDTGWLNDLWKYDVSADTWVHLGGVTMVTDFSNLPGVYDAANTPDPDNWPGARYRASVWKDNPGNFWMFGGRGYGDAASGRISDLWKFDISLQQWAYMAGPTGVNQPNVNGAPGAASASYTPGARESSAVWKDMNGNFWLYGGFAAGDVYVSDMWTYNVAADTWAYVNGSLAPGQATVAGAVGAADPSYTPGARGFSSTWTDAVGDLWLFGGLQPQGLNDLWRYNSATSQWSYQGGSLLYNQYGNYLAPGNYSPGNNPGARYHTVAWTDLDGNFLMFSGDGYGNAAAAPPTLGTFNEVWAFDAFAAPDRPTVTGASYVSPTELRITFSEAMGVGVTSPANYSISGPGIGTLAVNPDSVTWVGGNTYQLNWTSGAPSPGNSITITAAVFIQDAEGDAVGSPDSATLTVPVVSPGCNCGP